MIKPSQVWVGQFPVTDATGALVNADALPTGTLVLDGANNAASVTVANVSTGIYSFSVTIPSGATAGQYAQVRIAATVSTIATGGIVAEAFVDTVRLSDIPAGVWAYITRTLTQAAASVLAAVTGITVTMYRGTTWNFTLTVPDNSNYNTIYFSVKRTEDDIDNNAIVRVKNIASGLLRFNKAAPVAASNGTVEVLSTTSIKITILEAETVSAPTGQYVYDVKGVDNDGQVDMLSAGGIFNIVGDITRAIT